MQAKVDDLRATIRHLMDAGEPIGPAKLERHDRVRTMLTPTEGTIVGRLEGAADVYVVAWGERGEFLPPLLHISQVESAQRPAPHPTVLSTMNYGMGLGDVKGADHDPSGGNNAAAAPNRDEDDFDNDDHQDRDEDEDKAAPAPTGLRWVNSAERDGLQLTACGTLGIFFTDINTNPEGERLYTVTDFRASTPAQKYPARAVDLALAIHTCEHRARMCLATMLDGSERLMDPNKRPQVEWQDSDDGAVSLCGRFEVHDCGNNHAYVLDTFVKPRGAVRRTSEVTSDGAHLRTWAEERNRFNVVTDAAGRQHLEEKGIPF